MRPAAGGRVAGRLASEGTMKQDVMAAIENARASLDQAMVSLEDVPETDAEMVSYTAHRLKNYLAVVGATAELLEVYFAGHPDEQVKVWIEGLQHAVHLMSHDAGRLLHSANGRDPVFKSEKVDVALLVFRVCNFYRRKADWKNIQIHTNLQAEGCMASTDRLGLAASMDNLLSNAFKYSEPGSRIWVKVSREQDEVVCTVRDEGPGFTTDDLGRLFQKGVRLANSPTGGEISTGYGLAIAKDLVEKIGGSIGCESRPGHGAAFFIRLPAFSATP
jgi:two-component system sensor histidine kinase/response regulator